MRYMLLIGWNGQDDDPEGDAALGAAMPGWLEAVADRRLYGHELADVDTAVTVRNRGGQIVTSDGPFAESKEFVAGFDIIDCDDLDAAIEIAAQHPVAAVHAVEIRPFIQLEGMPEPHFPTDQRVDGPSHGRQRYLMLMCVNGIAEPDEEEAAVLANSRKWGERLTAAGQLLYGYGLQGVEAATTVRVRAGETVLSDGPFVEAKEFIGGFAIVDSTSLEEAVALAGAHPLASYHRVEVRPFAEDDGQR